MSNPALRPPGGLGLDDPSGKDDGAFLATMAKIEEKVLDLKRRIQAGELG